MSRVADIALGALLVLALGQAVLLARGGRSSDTFPLLVPGDPPGALQGPGAAARAIRTRVGAVGELVTIEDLARGVLALEEGALPGVAPLTVAERARLAPLMKQASDHRDELLRTEAQISEAETRLGEKATEIALTLTPDQRAWIIAQRDAVSVGQVEQAYWDALLKTLHREGAPE